MGKISDLLKIRFRFDNDKPVSIAVSDADVRRIVGDVYSEATQKLISFSSWINDRTGVRRSDRHKLGENPSQDKMLTTAQDWFWVPVQAMSNRCADIQKKLRAERKLQTKTDLVEITNHVLLDLFHEPNDMQTGYELDWISHAHLSTCGNAYWYKVLDGPGNTPSAFYPLMPNKCVAKICVTLAGMREGLKPAYVFTDDRGNDQAIPAENIIHFKLPSISNPYFGASPIEHMARAYEANLYAEIFHNNFYQNNARPDYVITFPQGVNVNDERLKAFKEQILSHHQGVDKAHLPLALGVDAKFHNLTLPAPISQYLEITKVSRDKFFAAFNFPAAKAGLAEGYSRAHAEADDYTWNKEAVKPRLTLFYGKLNSDLIYHYQVKSKAPTKLIIYFDDPIPKDKEFLLKQEEHDLALGLKTINEILASKGKEGIGTDGDQRLIKQGFVTLDSVKYSSSNNMFLRGVKEGGNSTNESAPRGGRHRDKINPSPILPNTPPSKLSTKDLWIICDRHIKDGLDVPRAIHEELWTRHVKQLDKNEPGMQDDCFKALRAQEKKILDAIAGAYPKAFDAVAHIKHDNPDIQARKRLKALRKASAWDVGNLIDWDAEIDVFVAIGDKWIQRAFAEALASTMLELVDDVPDMSLERVLAWLKKRIAKYSDEVVKASAETVDRYVMQAITDGQGIGELTATLTDFFEGKTGQSWAHYRSARIARTEINGATNKGALEGYEQSGVVMRKEWLSAIDERTRTFEDGEFDHVAANGEQVKIDEMFVQTGEPLEYPGDSGNGSPGNVINCRCTQIPVIEE